MYSLKNNTLGIIQNLVSFPITQKNLFLLQKSYFWLYLIIFLNNKMEFEFPKYPFLWDYFDMYNLIDYESNELNLDELDEHLIFLADKFVGSKIVHSIQTINPTNSTNSTNPTNPTNLTKNLNIHTWYLSQLNVFEQTETNIKIITNSKFKYKSNVKCFVFDPNDIIDNTKFEKKKFPNIAIIKRKISIIPELTPLLYIHTHNIKGIFRFSPNDNNMIKIKESVNNGVCYIVMEKLIVKLNIKIK